MRTMPAPADTELPRYTLTEHIYDVHASQGKWSVHVCTKSGTGRFYGPHSDGSIKVQGKVVTHASTYLPAHVIYALADAGFDCTAVEVS